MQHTTIHAYAVPGCFGCKVLSIGYQGLRTHSLDPTRTTRVVREEGPLAGQTAGHHVEHWDGRQDAVVTPPTIHYRTTVQEG